MYKLVLAILLITSCYSDKTDSLFSGLAAEFDSFI